MVVLQPGLQERVAQTQTMLECDAGRGFLVGMQDDRVRGEAALLEGGLEFIAIDRKQGGLTIVPAPARIQGEQGGADRIERPFLVGHHRAGLRVRALEIELAMIAKGGQIEGVAVLRDATERQRGQVVACRMGIGLSVGVEAAQHRARVGALLTMPGRAAFEGGRAFAFDLRFQMTAGPRRFASADHDEAIVRRARGGSKIHQRPERQRGRIAHDLHMLDRVERQRREDARAGVALDVSAIDDVGEIAFAADLQMHGHFAALVKRQHADRMVEQIEHIARRVGGDLVGAQGLHARPAAGRDAVRVGEAVGIEFVLVVGSDFDRREPGFLCQHKAGQGGEQAKRGNGARNHRRLHGGLWLGGVREHGAARAVRGAQGLGGR